MSEPGPGGLSAAVQTAERTEHPAGTLQEKRLLSGLFPWLFSRGGHLREQVVRAGLWVVLGTVATQGAAVVKSAVLGRLLSPHDFGLMGIATIAFYWIGYFTETGLNAGLIQKSGDIRPYLNTAWTIQILRSAGVAVLLFVGAPLGAALFHTPAAIPMVRAIGVVAILCSLNNPAVVYLRKEMDFRRDVMWRFSGAATGLVVAVVLGFALRNAWALMFSVIGAQAVETLMSYRVRPYRPRLQLDWRRGLELMRFGRWIFLLNLVTFVTLYADSIAVGKMLGATALGFYLMARQFALLLNSQIGTHVDGIMFPAFSKMAENDVRSRAFLRTLGVTAALALPIGCFLSVFAAPVVEVILGPKWVSISPCLRILAWAGVAKALTGATSPLLLAVGKPAWAARASALQVVIMLVCFYPLTTALGIAGMGLSVTLALLAATGYQLFLAGRLLGVDVFRFASAFKVGVLGCVPLLAGLLFSPSLSPALFMAAGLGLATYLAILVTAMRSQFGIFRDLWPARQPEVQL